MKEKEQERERDHSSQRDSDDVRAPPAQVIHQVQHVSRHLRRPAIYSVSTGHDHFCVQGYVQRLVLGQPLLPTPLLSKTHS